MLVRCLKTSSDPATDLAAGAESARTVRYALSVGREYIPLGFGHMKRSPFWGRQTFYELTDDNGELISAPAYLFTVVDGRLPPGLVFVEGSDHLLAWPPEFLSEFFHDRVGERDPSAVRLLRAAEGRALNAAAPRAAPGLEAERELCEGLRRTPTA